MPIVIPPEEEEKRMRHLRMIADGILKPYQMAEILGMTVRNVHRLCQKHGVRVPPTPSAALKLEWEKKRLRKEMVKSMVLTHHNLAELGRQTGFDRRTLWRWRKELLASEDDKKE